MFLVRPCPAAGFSGPVSNSLAAAAAAAIVAVGCLALPAAGAVVATATGTSAAGRPVAFRATLALAGDELTIDLENISPVDTSEPADLLGSFYFDIVRGDLRPNLVSRSAVGQVYQVRRNAADVPLIYTPPSIAGGTGSVTAGLGPSDLMATKPGDFTWQFRQLDPAYEPLAGFGLGTVGNSNLTPANFDPQIVDQNDFTIYRGADIVPKGNLGNRYLVRELARFAFGGVAGWSEADIGHRFTFGLGTSPDSVIVVTVPAPAPGPAAAVMGLGLAGLAAARRGRQAARRSAQPRSATASSTASSPAGTLACRPISRDTKTAM